MRLACDSTSPRREKKKGGGGLISRSVPKRAFRGDGRRGTENGTYVVAPNVNLREPPKLITFGAGLHDFLEGQVHPGVAIDQVAVESFTVFQFDQHWMALGRGEKAKGQHGGSAAGGGCAYVNEDFL